MFKVPMGRGVVLGLQSECPIVFRRFDAELVASPEGMPERFELSIVFRFRVLMIPAEADPRFLVAFSFADVFPSVF